MKSSSPSENWLWDQCLNQNWYSGRSIVDLLKEEYMNLNAYDELYDWPPSGPTIIDPSTARSLAREARNEQLIADLGSAIADAARNGKYEVSLTYSDRDEAQSVAALARYRGYSTCLQDSVLPRATNLLVRW